MPAMVIVIATIDLADPSTIDEVLTRSAPIQQATRDDEPGCQQYVFAADPCMPGRIVVHEVWADDESLVAHFDHPNYLAMRDLLHASGIVKGINAKHLVAASSPVYSSPGRPVIGFPDA
jgi:quinol monooxygenase YgiN